MTTLLSSPHERDQKMIGQAMTVDPDRRVPEATEEAVYDERMQVYKRNWCKATDTATPSLKADIISVCTIHVGSKTSTHVPPMELLICFYGGVSV